MPGPVSESYKGPSDKKPVLPRWAFPQLTDKEYSDMITTSTTDPFICGKCGSQKVHERHKGSRCPTCD